MKKILVAAMALLLWLPGAADQADLSRFDAVVDYLVDSSRFQPSKESLLSTAQRALTGSTNVREALEAADDEGRLHRNLIEALLKSLNDPWARLYTPEEVDRLRERMSGDRKSAMGVIVVPSRAPVSYRVVGVSPNGPSEGKLFSGDSIVWANGVEALEEDFLDVLVGEAGQVNHLRVRSENGETREVRVTLGDFDAPTAYLDDKEKGIIKITSFGAETAAELKEAMTELEGRPAIIDLRFNGGGYVTAAVASSDLFLDRGVKIVTTVSPKKQEVHLAQDGVTFDQPVCLLVNGRTASAAEIFAAALRTNANAFLVGDTTYGKGSVQRLVSLPGNWAVKYTTSLYQTSDGLFIDKVGLKPDAEIDMELALTSSKDDIQLAQALVWADKMKAEPVAKR